MLSRRSMPSSDILQMTYFFRYSSAYRLLVHRNWIKFAAFGRHFQGEKRVFWQLTLINGEWKHSNFCYILLKFVWSVKKRLCEGRKHRFIRVKRNKELWNLVSEDREVRVFMHCSFSTRLTPRKLNEFCAISATYRQLCSADETIKT